MAPLSLARHWTRWLAATSLILGLAVGPAFGAGQATATGRAGLGSPKHLSGIGNAHIEISTDSAEAQRYFDQGLALLHCFWDFEAYRAFQEAIRLDASAAMAHWGLHLSLNYNPSERSSERRAALARAIELMPSVADRERRYIRAVSRLESPGTEGGPAAYIHEMESLIRAYPDDLQAKLLLIKFLIADAGGLYTDPSGGGAGSNAFDRAREMLLPLLREHPDNVVVHHYWIHAHEFGSRPQEALESARRLPVLAPGSGHILHMPGHIYYKLGDYQGAYEAFQASLRFDRAYMESTGVGPVDNWGYVHNLSYLVANCAEDGRYREGIRYAETLGALSVSPQRSQSIGLGYIVYGGRTAATRLHLRYGRWQTAAESLAKRMRDWRFPSQVAADYVGGLLAYAKGMAAIDSGDESGAAQELQRLIDVAMKLTRQTAELSSDWYFEAARRILAISTVELGGALLSARGQHDQAIAQLSQALQMEQALGYGEPPHYFRPVHESLGAAHLRAGRWEDARHSYEGSLAERPNNGHGWIGIARSRVGAEQDVEARTAYRRLLEVWSHADQGLEEIQEARAWLAANP